MRRPMAGEEEDIDEVYAYLRANAIALALAYVSTLALMIGPAFLHEHDPPYRITALVGTHFLIWAVVSTVASCWVGFRYEKGWNLSNALGQFIIVMILIAAWAGLGYFETPWQEAAYQWIVDTFGWTYVLFALLLGIVNGLPYLIVQLRRRERAAVTRALEAESSSEKLARKTAESELRLLQAQVEPHFLYNTLANLRYLIQKGSPNALRMTDALIEYLRTSVPDIRALRVTLGREVDHTRHYLEIMQMRMGNRLAFEVDVPDALRATEVPPLLLLTLVENAVKHGIAPQIDGGEVMVSARVDRALIAIEVADTGVGVRERGKQAGEVPSTGVGLDNLCARLQLAYDQPVVIELLANLPRGTRVRLRLPREMAGTETTAAKVRVMSAEAAHSAGLLTQESHGGGQ
jgi:signal transduction histidine kinase